jgi:hypothetical protein
MVHVRDDEKTQQENYGQERDEQNPRAFIAPANRHRRNNPFHILPQNYHE